VHGKTGEYVPSTPPGNTGRSRLKSRPPKVIESMKVQNTSPVGTGSEPLTSIRVGTHMNTGRRERERRKKEGKVLRG
jgi:hypothetical protein